MSKSRPKAKTTTIDAAAQGGMAQAISDLAELCAAMAALLEQFPGIRRSADVEGALGLDRPLAWRVYRVATAVDAASSLQYLPTVNQLQRVLSQARQRGAADHCVQRVERGLASLESRIREVAGDHGTFCSLVSAHTEQGLRQIDLRVRRQAFRANAHLWGMHCRTGVCAVLLHPSSDGVTLDAFTVRGWVDLETARAARPLVLHSRFGVTRDQEVGIDEGPRVGEMRVMSGLGSSDPLDIRTVDAGDGRTETHLMAPGVGRAGRTTIFVGAPIERAGVLGDPESHRLGSVLCTPTEALHFDFITPAGWADPERTEVQVYARPNLVHHAGDRRSIDLVRVYEKPVCVTGVESVPPTADVPRWPDLLRQVIEERGLGASRFDVHRLRLPYPMLHSYVSLEVRPRGA